MIKEVALKSIHWLIAKDPWTQAIFEAAGIQFDVQAQRIVDIYNFNDFDKLSAKYLELYETMLGITTDESKSLADRRAYVWAMWNKSTPPTKAAIQSICDAWMNGECDVDAGAGYVEITFNSVMGVPADLDTLKKALLDVLPAHLEVQWQFKYLLINEVHGVMTIDEIQATPIGYFAG